MMYFTQAGMKMLRNQENVREQGRTVCTTVSRSVRSDLLLAIARMIITRLLNMQ